jgi:predicted phosphate transport protein (TIGR00153 family)
VTQAESLKRRVRAPLTTSMLLPIPQRDVHAILENIDRVARRVHDLGGLLHRRHLRFPDPLQDDATALSRACAACVEQVRDLVHQLDELAETGPRSRAGEDMQALLEALEAREQQARQSLHLLEDRLVASEDRLDPVTVLFLHRALGWFGDIAERSRQAGHCLQLLLAR